MHQHHARMCAAMLLPCLTVPMPYQTRLLKRFQSALRVRAAMQRHGIQLRGPPTGQEQRPRVLCAAVAVAGRQQHAPSRRFWCYTTCQQGQAQQGACC